MSSRSSFHSSASPPGALRANAMPITVALDGPAGAGKSTVAKAVARALNFRLLDTGAIYRCVALMAERQGLDWHNVTPLLPIVQHLPISFAFVGEVNHVFLADEDVTTLIRTESMSLGASIVSAHPPVRAGLLALQRRLASEGPGAVVEGRDIGTVVFPDAPVKFFLDASIDERARRRCAELQQRGDTVDFAQIREQVRVRDDQDRNRAVAPLRPAADAVVLDCTQLGVEDVVARIVAAVHARVPAISP